jgi:hypothetical protein
MWYENQDTLLTIIVVAGILGYTIRYCVSSYYKNKYKK